MTRQIPVWAMAAVLCAATATGAWGEVGRERDEPRGRGRGRIEEPPRPVSRDRGPAIAREGQAPKLFVIRFEHVSAGSFMGVLEQLARRGLGERLADGVTAAVHEESNAVVVCAPPEAGEMIMHLARELDQPSAFHERMRERHEAEKRGGFRRWQETPWGQRLGALGGLWRQWAMRSPGQPPCEQCPMMGKGPEAGPPKPGAPAGKPGPGAMLLSPPLIDKLHIRPDQVERIRQIVEEHKEQAMHLRERIARAVAEVGGEERAERAKEMAAKAGQHMAEMMAQCRERILDVLEPDQREGAERFFRPQMPGMMKMPAPGPSPEREEMERRRREEKDQQLREEQKRREHEERMRNENEERERQERLRQQREEERREKERLDRSRKEREERGERQEREERDRRGRDRQDRSETLERDLLIGELDL